MQNRTLGTDLSVSAVGLGCMGFSHGYGLPTEAGETETLLRRAVDLGYTFFDTAEVYGTQTDPHANETLVGQALAPVRDQVVLSTKFGLTFDFASGKTPLSIVPDSRPETIRRSVEGSLRRLGTDHIDLYFQHRIDPAVAPEEVAEGMADLIREGKITHWGISEANEDYLRRAHKVCPVTAVQNRYSMMARQYESLFPALEELEIGFVAFSPMANGFLTGQYGKGAAFDPRYDYRSSMPQFTDQAVDPSDHPGPGEGGHPRPDLPGLDAGEEALDRPHPRHPEGGPDGGERRGRPGGPHPPGGGRPGPGPGRHVHVPGVRGDRPVCPRKGG